MLGQEELAPEDQRLVVRARQLERFLTQPFAVTEQFTGHRGRTVALEAALDGCERILGDEFAGIPERYLYLVGGIDEAIARWRRDPSYPSVGTAATVGSEPDPEEVPA
jgi:F-type H+/Na+-transporting ATPase subunit beta